MMETRSLIWPPELVSNFSMSPYWQTNVFLHVQYFPWFVWHYFSYFVFFHAVRSWGQSANEERAAPLRHQRASQADYRVLLLTQLHPALLLHTPGLPDGHHRSLTHDETRDTFTNVTFTFKLYAIIKVSRHSLQTNRVPVIIDIVNVPVGSFLMTSSLKNLKKCSEWLQNFKYHLEGCIHIIIKAQVPHSQANKTTGMTWAIPSMLITACWTPRPMSAGRNHQRTHTETTGTSLLKL